MKVFAGESVAVHANGFPRVQRCWSYASQDILAGRHYPEMGNIYASPIPADVI
jgi:hypothetical protein